MVNEITIDVYVDSEKLSQYTEEDVPTVEFIINREECLQEAREMKRLRSFEAEGFWLSMAMRFE